ncbi:cation diffusion facilitator family transporter [Parendozoicomonas haliclonae]|uniref:Ferrous-iron efflux pump FieF n=1 Tax=Parendozoicomonas haliclonae TaxID=1960125 RepID=A0A1X7ALV8_9GAMM|nr:cation diffusion facilitator family transporter [Parendozoicomonas haliclonae]SMA49110.1 Ferrous-iron efflux pump FieF [Parendozoicomonas haliclonae]
MSALTEQNKATLLKRASRASVATATILLVAKLGAWGMTGSVSILATFMDSMLDAFASIINLVAVSIALKPADDDHHFGHGKAEQLAALAQSAFIAGSGLFLILHAVEGIRDGTNIDNNRIALGVMAFSMALTLVLVTYQHYVVKKTGSLAIQTDAMHYRMDLLTNLGVVIALIVASMGFPLADPLIGMAIAVYMIASVGRVAWEAIQMLMDKALDQESEDLIREQVLSVEQVIDLHNLRTRMSGITPVIQMDLDLDGRLSLEEAHEIGRKVKLRLLEQMPDADITIHLDPN